MVGWVKLHRRVVGWGWYRDVKTFKLFMHLLLTAQPKDGHSLGIPVKKGEVITGRKRLALETGLSEQEVRTSLKKLYATREITSRSTSKYSIITINNYCEYQSKKSDDQPTNQPANQPSSNQVATTIKEVRRKKTTHTSSESDRRFISFWEKYPRKVAKQAALRAWKRGNCGNGVFEELMAGLEKATSGPWANKDKQYIPHPATWLNQERWTDEQDGTNSEDGEWY